MMDFVTVEKELLQYQADDLDIELLTPAEVGALDAKPGDELREGQFIWYRWTCV